MKIQKPFLFRKNFRFEYNENRNQFLFRKNFKFVFNENTNHFFI